MAGYVVEVTEIDDVGDLLVPGERVEALLRDPRVAIVDVAPLAMWSVDADLVVRYTLGEGWPPGAGPTTKRAGLPVDQAWLDHPKVAACARRAVVDGVAQRVDLQVGGRVVQMVYRPLRVEDRPGRPVAGALGFAVDVTAEHDAARRATVLTALARRAIAAGDDVGALLEGLSAVIGEYTGAAVAVRLLTAEAPQGDVPQAEAPQAEAPGAASPWYPAHRDPVGGDGRPVIDIGEELLVRQLAGSQHPSAPLRMPHPATGREVLICPMTGSAGLLGALCVLAGEGSRAGLLDDPQEQAFLADLAARTSLRVESARNRIIIGAERERRGRRAAPVQVLAECSRAAQATGTLHTTDLDRIVRRAAEVLGGSTFVFEVRGEKTRLVALAGADPASEAEQRQLYSQVMPDSARWAEAMTDGQLVQRADASRVMARRGEAWRAHAEWLDGSTFVWSPVAGRGGRGHTGAARGPAPQPLRRRRTGLPARPGGPVVPHRAQPAAHG